jgi:hypothetical protein
MADRKAMDHARGGVERAHAIAGDRMAGIVERMEAAGGIERLVLEEREEIVGLAEQPAAMAGVFSPRGGFDGQPAHAFQLPAAPPCKILGKRGFARFGDSDQYKNPLFSRVIFWRCKFSQIFSWPKRGKSRASKRKNLESWFFGFWSRAAYGDSTESLDEELSRSRAIPTCGLSETRRPPRPTIHPNTIPYFPKEFVAAHGLDRKRLGGTQILAVQSRSFGGNPPGAAQKL